MLRTGNSIQLIVASYKLPVDLEKHFPRAYLSGVDIPYRLLTFHQNWLWLKRQGLPLLSAWIMPLLSVKLATNSPVDL
ncbi:unnamed protein product [Trifolium pratense]|uniref:Uncharacterized protein n=1 Tax=Trifolium pratense TaxID=57577 RepID=A0ACB0KCU2_TRIPR|nr:unnamed protein product [Trifolium pratense]